MLALVLRTEHDKFPLICKRYSLTILRHLVMRNIFGHDRQFIGLDKGLLGDVGAVSGVADFLDGFILIDVVLVGYGKILAKRDH